jgi:hypothetical protein
MVLLRRFDFDHGIIRVSILAFRRAKATENTLGMMMFVHILYTTLGAVLGQL